MKILYTCLIALLLLVPGAIMANDENKLLVIFHRAGNDVESINKAISLAEDNLIAVEADLKWLKEGDEFIFYLSHHGIIGRKHFKSKEELLKKNVLLLDEVLDMEEVGKIKFFLEPKGGIGDEKEAFKSLRKKVGNNFVIASLSYKILRLAKAEGFGTALFVHVLTKSGKAMSLTALSNYKEGFINLKEEDFADIIIPNFCSPGKRMMARHKSIVDNAGKKYVAGKFRGNANEASNIDGVFYYGNIEDFIS